MALDHWRRTTAPQHPLDVERGEPGHDLACDVAAEVEADTKKANSTKASYVRTVGRFIEPKFGSFRVREVSVPIVERVLREIAQESGAGSGKAVKSCLSGMFAMAVRHGAVAINPVRDAKTVTSEKAPVRALTVEETAALIQGLSSHLRAHRLDLVDIVVFMLGTGVRIGEACALQLDRVNLEEGTLEISRTLGPKGIEDRTKSKAGRRVLALPPHIVAMLKRRINDPKINTDVAIFPSPLGRVWNESNVTGRLREVLDDLGWDWVSSHTFRKTVATGLDEGKLSGRQLPTSSATPSRR